MKRFSTLVILGGVIVACATPEPMVDTEAVRAEVVAALADYRAKLLADNDEGALDRLASDIHVMEPGVNVRGQEAHEFFRGLLSGATIRSFETRPNDYFIHGDVVYETGEYDETVEMNGQTTTIEGFYFLRWVKGEDGMWRFSRIVAGPRAAPPGM